MIKKTQILSCCFVVALLILALNKPLFSYYNLFGSSTPLTDAYGDSVDSYQGTGLCGERNVWINVDSLIPNQGYAYQVYVGTETSWPWNEEFSNSFFDDFDYSPSTAASLIISNSTGTVSSYFVSVYNEKLVHFSAQYYDSFGNDPSTGYPQVSYWLSNSQGAPASLFTLRKAGASSVTTLSLSSTTTHWLYAQDVNVPCGTYQYQYIAKNDMSPEYVLNAGSFTVCQRPQNVLNAGANSGAYVTNAKVILTWAAVNPEQGGTTYKLYVGKDPNNLQLVYTGANTSYQLNTLDYSSKYYWQVEAIDIYGISAYSVIYNFITIAPVTKAYNFPNPCNPAKGQYTNIVFEMQDSGFAEITIYTEFGHPVWRQTFYNLNKGSNQVQYNGRDDNGKELYNGTYVCIIKEKFGYGEDTDKCRILIIK